MNNRSEQTQSLWIKVAQSPWVQGPFLGSSVAVMVTPLLNWNNHVLNHAKTAFKNPMMGAFAYASSAIPGYATTFVTKALLNNTQESRTSSYDLLTSFVAGAFSGLVCTPFESVAQNKFITNSAFYKTTALKMIEHHGYTSFFRGGASIMLREGLWSTVYLSAIPVMSQSLQDKGVNKVQADLLSVLTVAGGYGLLSSPLNQLRFKKQHGLTEDTINKSYFEHAKTIFNQDVKSSHVARMRFFFKGGLARTKTTTVAAGLMVKGGELYNHTIEQFSKM